MYINYDDKELYLTLKPVEVPANGQATTGVVKWGGTVEINGQPTTALSFTEENGFVKEMGPKDNRVQTPNTPTSEVFQMASQ